MSEKKLSPKAFLALLSSKSTKVRPYIFPIFLIFIGLIYGFLFLRINSLVSMEPSESDVTSQVKTAKVPYIDADVVEQLKALKDNSTSVESFFENRTNPFE